MRSNGTTLAIGLVMVGIGVPALFVISRIWGGVITAVGLILIFPACRDWLRGLTASIPVQLRVTYGRPNKDDALGETLTFSVSPAPITKLILEPFTFTQGGIRTDPLEVLLVDPVQPVTCPIYVELTPGGGNDEGLALVRFLEKKRSGRTQVYARFTDVRRRRRRIPFNVEVMGTHHSVEWVPGPIEDASPDW